MIGALICRLLGPSFAWVTTHGYPEQVCTRCGVPLIAHKEAK